MKKLLITLCCFFTLAAFAVPSKRGNWRTVRLKDGTTIRLELVGDEHFHFFRDSAGVRYFRDAETGEYARVGEMQFNHRRAAYMQRLNQINARRRTLGVADTVSFKGEKKGVILLVQFADTIFKPTNTAEYYDKIANRRNFSDENGFKGSVRDYFYAQSLGKFDVTFDIVGPITLSRSYAYYGKNNDDRNDEHAGEMVAEACQKASATVDFSKYDWNNDGEVDVVYVLYAGKGENASLDANTVWPHQWTLEESDYGKSITLNGVVINRYACSNEVKTDGKIEGIGTICHEFSHCLGFPDAYDVSYGGSFGMGSWDLMDNGCFLDGGFSPCGYTAYEKMQCGWTTPVELRGDTAVVDVQPIAQGGSTYVIYNKAHRDEYYLIENRQRVGWDKELPGTGLIITHIDYDKDLFAQNLVNAIGDFTKEYGLTNDHQRYTMVHADNDDDSDYWLPAMKSHTKKTEETDAYPFLRNDSLTNRSLPAATTFHKNVNGNRRLNVSITNMAVDDNGTASFVFRDFSEQPRVLPAGCVFYESFNDCQGHGGNDNDFYSGNAGSATFYPDYDDWIAEASFGGDHCAKFGTNSKSGKAQTPVFSLYGPTTLSFLAAPFDEDGGKLKLSVSGNASISPSVFTLSGDKWTECRAVITGEGEVCVTFLPERRMFLDEVKAMADPTAVTAASGQPRKTDRAIYSIMGYKVADKATGTAHLPSGIYIYQGKKFVIQ